jgi:predicted amidohydrolase YtcJ
VASAVAVAGSRIVAVGDPRDVARAAGSRAERIDCRGATILPGLVDPHLHLFGLAARDAHLDCAGFRDLNALLDAVGARAAALDPGVWVRGEGLDETLLGRLPRAAELERVAPRNPVRLRHRSRHASVLSESGLARLPVEMRGTMTGLIAGREDVVGATVGPLVRGELERGLVRASRELAALGITTVADATPRRWPGLAPLRRVMDAGSFAQRVFAMRPWTAPAWRARGRLYPGPVKIMVEESPTGLVPRAAELARRIRFAAARGAQVAVHCVGAPTLVAVLEAFAALPRHHRHARRHRLEHLADCPPPLVARIAALELMVVTNPAFVYWRGDVYRTETEGTARAWLYRARSLVAAGISVAGASDAPVVAPSPWVGIAAARMRRTRDGHVLGARERVDAARALAFFTTSAARALRADQLGVLVPGAPADLIVVTPDPLRAPAATVRETTVRLTMIDGSVVWQA